MKTNFIFLLIVVLVSTLAGCTVEKRLFNKGYHIEWNRKFNKSSESAIQQTGDELISLLKAEDDSQKVNEVKKPLLETDTNYSENIVVPEKSTDLKTGIDKNVENNRQKRIQFRTSKRTFVTVKQKDDYSESDNSLLIIALLTGLFILLLIGIIIAFNSPHLGIGAVFLLLVLGWVVGITALCLLVALFLWLIFDF